MSGVREVVQGDGEQDGAESRAELEERARRAGWAPLEEYRGERPWKDAAEFLRVAEENWPKAKERNQSLDRKLRRVEQELGLTREALQEMRVMASKSEERAYERARQDLLAQQQQAVQSADTASFNQVTQELQRLEAEKPKPAPAPQAPPPSEDVQELQRWVATKPWWGKDQALTQMVTAMHANHMAKNPGLSQMEGLREVEDMLAAKYPQELGRRQLARNGVPPAEDEPEEEPVVARGRRETPANVGGATFTGAAPRRSVRPSRIVDLPREEQAEARRAFEKYKGLMANAKTPFTEEEYVRNYLDQ